MLIGVLAIQGGFEAHLRMFEGLGAEVREVRLPSDLDGLDALVIPGGESTAISMGSTWRAWGQRLRAHHDGGRPIFGTCAGNDRLRRRAPRPDRRNERTERVWAPAAELRGRPRGERDRGSSRFARCSFVHRGCSATGRGCRCWPPTADTRLRFAKAGCSPARSTRS